jgi:raffinose/stachyose/melibiose transport system substrate-binding protein
MKINKIVVMSLVLIMLLASFAGCKPADDAKPTEKPEATEATEAPATDDKETEGAKDPVTITVSVVANPDNLITKFAEEFMAENDGVIVEVNAVGQDYENVMKVKMASKQLPDIFETHGWSELRYGEYLADLRDEAWVADLSSSIKPAVTDDEGKVYVLPMDQEKSGLVYNVTLLEEYGIEVPLTYDDFLAACQTIVEKSNGEVTPLHIAGGDSWPMGFFLDYFSNPSFLTSKDNIGQQFIDGTLDWKNFTPLPEKLLELQEKGYLNKDVVTATYSDAALAFADNKVAFAVLGPYLVNEAAKTNPDIKGGIMPVPAIYPDDEATFVGGERFAIGVWKDSANVDVAKKFLAFCAKPENVKAMCEFNGTPSGLNGVEVDLGEYTKYYEMYSDLRIFPYFDRIYLPSGMWDTMCKNGQDLLAGAITPEQFSENMKIEYDRLRASK